MYGKLFQVILLVFPSFIGFTQSVLCVSDTVSLNQNIVSGTFANGFKYFILKNVNPDNRIEIALVNKVGFPNETEDETHSAHLIEHLGLRGTAHFPNGVTNFMKSKGLIFAQDFNANTSDVTMFDFSLPSGDTSLFNQTLQALHDCAAGGILFDPRDFEEEQAAVLNEAIISDTRGFRSLKESAYLVFDQHPKYKVRLTEEMQNITRLSISSLKAFYDKWYRPDLQAIVVVGNVDVTYVHEKVRSMFSSMIREDRRLNAFSYDGYDVPLTGKDKVVVVSHGSDDSSTSIEILMKQKGILANGADADKSFLVDELTNAMLSNRFQTTHFNDSILSGRVFSGISRHTLHPLANIDAIRTTMRVSDVSNIVRGLDMVLFELQRIRLWGFTEGEFALAKQIVGRRLRYHYKNPSAASLKRLLVANFAHGATLAEGKFDNLSRILADVSLTEVNSLITPWLGSENNTDILLSVSDECLLDMSSVSHNILESVKAIRKMRLTNYVDRRPLELAAVPERKLSYQLISKRENITEILLKNGIKVILKGIKQSNDRISGKEEVSIQGFRLGGWKESTDQLRSNAIAAAQTALFTGFGKLNHSELQEWKRAKNRLGYLSILPYVSDTEEGIKGGASLDNYESLLQLTYHYFATPEKDEYAFQKWVESVRNSRLSEKGGYWQVEDSIEATISPKKLPGENLNFENAQLTQILKVYKERFSNAGNFTFVIAGYFDTEDIIGLTARYLGSIPVNLHRKAKKKKNGAETRPKETGNLGTIGNASFVVVGDSVGNVTVRMIFAASKAISDKEYIKLELINESLQTLLFERLRIEEKAVYYVSSMLKYRGQDGFYAIDISFQSAPEKVNYLADAVTTVVSSLVERNIDENTFRNALEAVRQRFERQRSTPNYWVNFIISRETDRNQLDELSEQDTILNNITPSDLRIAASDMLDVRHYALFQIL